MSNTFQRIACLITVAVATACIGCLGPSRVSAPKWDAEGVTDACMEQCDEDGDGFISKTELKNAPGLEYAFRQLDTNEDKQLSRDEVLERIKVYVDSQVGLQGFTCYVRINNQPLIDGKVRLVPEPFLADFVKEADGSVIDERNGMAEVSTPNDQDIFGVMPGMYRVEITSPSITIPAKYNTETELGVEVAPVTNPFEPPGGIVFNVRGRR